LLFLRIPASGKQHQAPEQGQGQLFQRHCGELVWQRPPVCLTHPQPCPTPGELEPTGAWSSSRDDLKQTFAFLPDSQSPTTLLPHCLLGLGLVLVPKDLFGNSSQTLNYGTN